jgi:hypothetical protein
MRGAGSRLLGAILAAVQGREREFRNAAKEALVELRNPATLATIVDKIRARTSVFRKTGIGFGAATGLAVGIFGASAGGFGNTAIFSGGGWCYGYLLSWLAREGYLPLPEEDSL